MYSTQNHITSPSLLRDELRKSFLSGNLDNPAKHLRSQYLIFLNRLVVEPTLAHQLGLTVTVRQPTPTIQLLRKLSRQQEKARQLKQQHPAIPKLTCKTSIQDRIMVEEDPEEIFNLSSGLLCSSELIEPPMMDLLYSNIPLTSHIMEQLLNDSEMEIGLTSIVLLCKYILAENKHIGKDTLLRLFVTSTIVALKLSYELVSPKFIKFLAQLLQTDVNTVHALERHFVKILNYDLNVNPTHIKRLITLIVM